MTIPHQQLFSKRELQIIELLLQGKSTKLIASQIGVSTCAEDCNTVYASYGHRYGGPVPQP